MNPPDPSFSREQMALLEPYGRIGLNKILLVATVAHVAQALAELRLCAVVGFDTESKPTFRKGEVSDGPHVVQFSTPEKAYIFQLHQRDCHTAVCALIESEAIIKVGFGLSSDYREISRKLGVSPKEVLDLNSIFKRRGCRKSVGVKGAVALVFQRRFLKSKSAATSNWASHRLTDTQVLYAANDAYAAIQVYHQLAVMTDFFQAPAVPLA